MCKQDIYDKPKSQNFDKINDHLIRKYKVESHRLSDVRAQKLYLELQGKFQRAENTEVLIDKLSETVSEIEKEIIEKIRSGEK